MLGDSDEPGAAGPVAEDGTRRKFAYPPNLVVIDGGPAQVAAAAAGPGRTGHRRRRRLRPGQAAGGGLAAGRGRAGDPAAYQRGAVPAAAGQGRGAPVRDHLSPGEALRRADRPASWTTCPASGPPGGRRCCGTSARCARSRGATVEEIAALPGFGPRLARGGASARSRRVPEPRGEGGRHDRGTAGRRRSSSSPGMSGAGRSTAAKSLEDLDWFVADNLPPDLLPTMVDLARRAKGAVPQDRRRRRHAQPRVLHAT